MHMKKPKHTCRVLLAEDNPNDIADVVRVVARDKDRFLLEVVTDGEAALEFLKKQGSWRNAWTPDLVILNINMPKVNGWGVLKAMKADPSLRIIPVAVWSITERPEDVRRAIEGGCSGMFTKPCREDDREAQVSAILEFQWWAWSYP